MRSTLGISALLLLFSMVSFAAQADRIAGTIDGGNLVPLAGNVAYQAQPPYDRGLVEAAMPMNYIVLQTKPSPSQQKELNKLLAQQLDKSSPNYRKWLTPEQYAERFALSPSDMKKIAIWLAAQGFAIVQPARGRDWIAFSGTAATVETTFHTEIHYYSIDGESHYANATGVSIPQALDGIVAGFRGLDDFKLKAMGIRPLRPWDVYPSVVNPFFTVGGGHALAPGDVATIYDITPLYNAGIDGAGQKLVIVGQSDIHMTDLQEFRTNFSLAANPPKVVVTGSDPGFTSDEAEADLDLEWSAAVARNASVTYVNSTNAFNSATYAIDQDLAPVISMSFGGCERLNQSFIPVNEPTMQKANSEGITFLASSGDSGAAGCDSDSSQSATQGLAVNYPASSPEVTGVGGNEFNGDLGNPSQYWGNSNGTNGGSALSYIGETAWNDTAENGVLSATGGGASSCDSSGCASGFPKPTWQTGTGVPKDGVRDVPDAAMAASPDHDGYLFCSKTGGADCTNGVATNETIGGTSASTPVLAGIIVLLNQQLANSPAGAGNINPELYTLAQDTTNGVFHDITTGNNIVPCTKGSTDCPSGGSIGYNAGTGYDQVTGLGSVDANAFVTQFGTTATTTTLTSSANPANSGSLVTFTATVKSTGSGSPTGTVTFDDGSTAICSQVTLASGQATCPTSSLSIGGHSITAAYGGDKDNGPSTSAILIETITANGGATTNTVVISAPNPSSYASPVTFTATVNTTSGNPPSNTVTFQDGSTPIGFASVTQTGASSGVAALMFSGLTVGTHSITGLYSGDSNNNASSTSPIILQVVIKAPTTTAAPSLSPAGVNNKSTGPVAMSAAISPANGPTGTISFSVDGTAVGSAKVGGSFNYNPNGLAVGNHSVVATYQGDSNFNGSTSIASTLSVEDFAIAANPTTVNVSSPGQSGQTTLTITPEGGFNQTLSYVCSGLPTLATCLFSAASSTTENVTITTLASARLQPNPFRSSGIFYAMLLPGLLGLVVPFSGRKRNWRGIMLIAVLAITLLWMPACGGGSSGSSTSQNTGTPTGTSTVTITASTSGAGGLSHSVTITLNVQ